MHTDIKMGTLDGLCHIWHHFCISNELPHSNPEDVIAALERWSLDMSGCPLRTRADVADALTFATLFSQTFEAAGRETGKA